MEHMSRHKGTASSPSSVQNVASQVIFVCHWDIIREQHMQPHTALFGTCRAWGAWPRALWDCHGPLLMKPVSEVLSSPFYR